MIIKVILINPWLKSVTESRVETTDIQSLYKIMSWLDHKVNGVMHGGTFPNGDNLLMADMVDGDNLRGFSLGEHKVWGCGVIMGNNEGEWDAPFFMLTELQDRIRFTC